MRHLLPFFVLVLLYTAAHAHPHERRHRGHSRYGRSRSGFPRPGHIFGNYIAVCNRNDASISLVNPHTYKKITYALPSAEPMYFACLYRSFRRRPAELWVADRANSRLVVLLLKRNRIVPDGYVPTPKGLFHSMTTQDLNGINPLSYSTCDEDNVVIVHEIETRKVVCRLQMPKHVAYLGAKPHDVTGTGRYVFATFIGASDGHGYVASYDVRKCKLIRYIRTAEDPHVSVRTDSRLWIAAQGGQVLSCSVPTLRWLSIDESLPSPHGMFMSFDERYLYVTNIAEGGKNAVVVFDQQKGKKLYCPQVDASFPTPHNPTASFDGSKLYITHSGANQTVNTAWDIGKDGCLVPDSEVVFESGSNPFGTAVVPPPSDRELRLAVYS